jgi:hypothetical protein
MAYDSARGKVVMFGGVDVGSLGDTWEWDGTSGTWTQHEGVGGGPEAREGHTMAYDSARGRVVLFGGHGMFANYLDDTWEWDGASASWTERTPTTSNPSARQDCGMAYESNRRGVVLFGGKGGGGNYQDTWEWDGEAGSWTELAPQGPIPSARSGHVLASNGNGSVLLFGGEGSGDLWEWDGGMRTWTQVPTGTGPGARTHHGMVFDSGRLKYVV